MGGCKKCMGTVGWLMLILGIIFLGKDYGWSWLSWWSLSWWTALFLLWGLKKLCMGSCSDCQKMCSAAPSAPAKKKRR